jgi:thiol-disulfide isomerase/thioredoxin
VLLAVTLVACAGSAPSTSPDDAPGDEPLAFSGRTLDGGRFDGREVDGDVLLWFWAPWCPRCNASAPHLAAVMADRPDVTYIGIPGHDSDAAMQDFVDRHGLQAMTQVVDDNGDLWALFGVRVQPVWILLPDGGDPVTVHGPLERDGLADHVTAAFGDAA